MARTLTFFSEPILPGGVSEEKIHVFDYRKSSRTVQEVSWFGEALPTAWSYGPSAYVEDWTATLIWTDPNDLNVEHSTVATLGNGPDWDVIKPSTKTLPFEQPHVDGVSVTVFGDFPELADVGDFMQSTYTGYGLSGVQQGLNTNWSNYLH